MTGDARHKGTPLTQQEVDALPSGAQVVITWSGGNGPWRYTIRRVEAGQSSWVEALETNHAIEFVGPEAPNTVVTRV